MNYTLLVRPKFSRGDGSNGYMLKLAAANGLKVSNFRSMGISFGTELANEGLCTPEGEPYLKQLHTLALRLATAKRTDARRYCPECLAEGNCADLLCEVAFCVACPRHGVEQRTECHECGDRIAWTTGTSTHCTCGSDLRLHPTNRSVGTSILVAGIVKQAAMTGRASHGPFKDLTLEEWLAFFDFLARCSLRRLGDQKTGSPRLFEDDDGEARKNADAAAEALRDWPATFIARLEELQSGPAEADATRLTKVFGPLYRHIYCNLAAEVFAPIRLEFEAYVAKSWWSGLSSRNSRLGSGKGAESQWLSVMDVRRRLKLGHPAVRWLMDRGILEARMDVRGDRSFAYASRKSVEAYEAHLANTVSSAEAARLLGVLPHHGKELAAALDDAKYPSPDSSDYPESVVSRDVVNELLDLVRTAPPMKTTGMQEVTLAIVLRAWRLSPTELTTMFSKIRTGAIPIIGRLDRGSDPDLRSLVVSYADIHAIRPARRQPGQMTVQEVAADLKVKDAVVYHLVRNGMIKAKTSKERFKRSVILEKTLHEFKARYILGSAASLEHGMSSIALRKYLASRGIQPRCSADSDGCRVLIFRNDDAYQAAIRQLNPQVRPGSGQLQSVPTRPGSFAGNLRLVGATPPHPRTGPKLQGVQP